MTVFRLAGWEHQRQTDYERNHNLNTFVFSTPFTETGKSRGAMEAQFNRKTIITTENHFPYLKTRVKVVKTENVILTPVEVAIEDVESKLNKLEAAMAQNSLTLLQLELQSCVATVVMAGPLQIAKTFLRSHSSAWQCFISLVD